MAVYWHVTPKDDVSPCTALADALHRYHVRIKGVEDKNPCSKCTRKYSTGHITKVISPQSVKIDGVPCHVKDLWPVIQTQLLSSDESDSEESEHLIYLNSNLLDSDSDASSLSTDEVSTETRTADESTHEGEAYVIPLQRMLPPCSICDHEISEECRENCNLPD